MSPMLEITNLHVAYGKVEAVRGVSLTLNKGQIVTVIGPNGAGKTTLLAATIGLLPSTGRLMFEGEDLFKLDVEARVEHGFCLAPETRELFGELTVYDNLVLGAYPRRSDRAFVNRALDEAYGRFPRLAERRMQRADTLSGGERQMLAVGRALMSEPRMLLLDEPSLGLSPVIVDAMYDSFKALHAQGLTILLAEQSVDLALETADRAYVLQVGRTVLSGAASEMLNNTDVQRIYLGVE